MRVSLRLRCIRSRRRYRTPDKLASKVFSNKYKGLGFDTRPGTTSSGDLKRCGLVPAESRDGLHYIGGSFWTVPGGPAPRASLVIGHRA